MTRNKRGKQPLHGPPVPPKGTKKKRAVIQDSTDDEGTLPDPDPFANLSPELAGVMKFFKTAMEKQEKAIEDQNEKLDDFISSSATQAVPVPQPGPQPGPSSGPTAPQASSSSSNAVPLSQAPVAVPSGLQPVVSVGRGRGKTGPVLPPPPPPPPVGELGNSLLSSLGQFDDVLDNLDNTDVNMDDPDPDDQMDSSIPIGSLLEDSTEANVTSIFSIPTPSSSVFGENYLQQEIGVDNIREALIEKEEGKMSSPDKKRLIRVLMEVKFVWMDLVKALALSLHMRPLSHIMTMVNQLGPAEAAKRWDSGQLSLKKHVDGLSEKIRVELSHVYIANCKVRNKFGFGLVDNIIKNRDLQILTKDEMVKFEKAVATMNRAKNQDKGKKSKGKNPGKNARKSGKGQKPDSGDKPKFPKCPDCGKIGHVKGDAKCKAPAP